MATTMQPRSPVYYCDSEQNSACSTPFVSAPSSPTQRKKNPNLYYYFSAPSSPPRRSESRSTASSPPVSSQQQPEPRGLSFTECEFQFQSRFESPRASSASQQISGFYFSAPTSPDRKSAGGCSYWSEMPGTPKMIFGGGGGGTGDGSAASVIESPDFEFSSSRMSESDSTVFSAQMSSADELFFKGQLLPLKLRPRANHHTWGGGGGGGGGGGSGSGNAAALTSSDSSGSSQTMGSSSCASAPQSPTGGRKPFSSTSPTRIKSAVMGSICGSPKAASASKGRFFSPLHFFRRYQSMVLSSNSSSRNSAGSSSSSPDEVSSSKKKRGSSKDSSPQVPRPARSSSRGRTLKELLHLSSVHKKNKQQQRVPQPVEEPPAAPPTPASEESKKDGGPADAAKRSPSPRKKATHGPPLGFDHKRRLVDRSLVGDYSKKFNQHQRSPTKVRAAVPPPAGAAAAAASSRRRFHSGSILDLHYNYHQVPGSVPLGGKRFHSGSIVPESEPGLVPKSGPLKPATTIVGASQRMYYSGPILDKAAAGGSSASSSGSSGGGSRRFSGVVVTGGGEGSAPPSRSVSPRRAAAAHELHYGKRASAAEQEMRRRTSFLPYKQGLLGCLGCATMRIAGLSSMAATSAGTATPRVH